jgi:uncharacterized membrane protein
MVIATAQLYDWLMLLHVIAAMVWVGGGLMLAVLATRVVRARRPDEVERFIAGLRVIGPRVLAPATFAVVGFGVWMVLNSSAWSFDQAWVQLGLGLFAAAVLVGAAYLSRAAIKAERAARQGEHDEAVRQLARWSWGYGVIVVLLIVATWDMVTKPGL